MNEMIMMSSYILGMELFNSTKNSCNFEWSTSDFICIKKQLITWLRWLLFKFFHFSLNCIIWILWKNTIMHQIIFEQGLMTFPIFFLSATLTIIYIFLFKSNNKTRTTICHYGFFLFVYLLWGRAHASSSRDKNYLLQFLCDFFPWELTDKEKQQLCYNNFWKDTFALLQKKIDIQNATHIFQFGEK